MRMMKKSEVGYSIARIASHRLVLKTSASVVSVRPEVTARPEVRSRPHSAPGRAKKQTQNKRCTRVICGKTGGVAYRGRMGVRERNKKRQIER